MNAPGYGGGSNNNQYGGIGANRAPQFRSNAVTAQPGSAYDSQRFSYSNNQYGPAFNGQSSGPYTTSTPSAPQSDVRSQPVNQGSSGYGQRQAENMQNQYRSAQLPSPSYQLSESHSRPQYQSTSNVTAANYASPLYRTSGGAHQQQQGQQDSSRQPAIHRYQDNASPTPIAYQKPPPRNAPSPAAYQERARASQHSYQAANAQHNDLNAPQTVDPSQFHDSYYEQQRKKAVDEARAQEARQKAEEAEARERARQQQAEEDHRQAEEEQRKAKEPKKKKTPKPKAAARAASSAAAAASEDSAGKQDSASEFAALFAKMRELQEKDPEMMTKMWDQERQYHLTKEAAKGSPSSSAAAAAPTQSTTPNSASKGEKKATASSPTARAEAPSSSSKPAKAPKPSPKFNKKADKVSTTSTTASQVKPTLTPVVTASAVVNTALPGIQAAVTSPGLKPSMPTAPTANMSVAQKPKANSDMVTEKKRILADAAARLIEQYPENRGRTISPGEILSMLSGNIIFTDLCVSIERRGFKINRAAFARGLIAAEADMKPRATPLPALGGKLAQDAQVASGASSIPSPLQPTTGNASPPIPQNIANANANASQAMRRSVSETGSSKASPKPQKAPKSGKPKPNVPLTKEDLARKRTFSELVDLTQLSDDEPMDKRLRLDLPDFSTHFSGLPPTTTASPAVPARPASPKPFTPAKKMPTLPPGHPITKNRAYEMLDRHHAVRRSRYNAKTIARDILLASGRHPHLRPLNVHLDILKSGALLVREDADLGTLRWDLIDPGGMAPGEGMANEPDIIEPEDFADDEANDSESEIEVVHQKSVSGSGSKSAKGPTPAPSSTASTPRFPPNPPAPKKPATPASASKSQQKSTPKTRPRAGTPTSGTGMSYTELNARNEALGIPKSKGRPVGWRKHMQQGPPKESGGGGNGGNGGGGGGGGPSKPPKKPKSPPEAFVEFKCEWDNCTASLQNLDTLRRHVFKKHWAPDSSGLAPCLWDSCGRIETVRDGPRTTSRKVRNFYDDEREWRGHVERVHLTAVAWRLGDGPNAGLADPHASGSELSEAYLSDKDGRQVTPRVQMPTSSRGFTAVNNVPRGRPSALESAQELLRGAEQRRARVGAGIDHGGARSVDDEMRATMMDDSDGVPEPVNEVDMLG